MSLLYKFMDFETFIDTIQQGSLLFRHPTRWDDPYEYEPVKYFINHYATLNKDLGAFAWLCLACESTFAQCWTRLAESDALWKIYSNNSRTIRLCVDEKQFENFDDTELHDVVYNDDYKSYLDCFDDFLDYKKSFCIKRTVYEHEREVRILHLKKYENKQVSYDRSTSIVFREFSQLENFREAYGNGMNLIDLKQKLLTHEDILREIYTEKNAGWRLKIDELSTFINSVMLHPSAPDWFDSTVATFCSNNSIKYIGKSNIYTFLP